MIKTKGSLPNQQGRSSKMSKPSIAPNGPETVPSPIMSGTPKLCAPEYKLALEFSATEVAGAAKWLKKLERDLLPYRDPLTNEIPATLYLESIYFLLVDDAEQWAEGDYAVADAFQNPGTESLETVIKRLKQRFLGRHQEPTISSFRDVISELGQWDSETLKDYYGRVRGQLKQFLGQDPETAVLTSSDLSV